MDKEGLKQSLDKLLNQGVEILSVAIDRHTGLSSDEKMFNYMEINWTQ